MNTATIHVDHTQDKPISNDQVFCNNFSQDKFLSIFYIKSSLVQRLIKMSAFNLKNGWYGSNEMRPYICLVEIHAWPCKIFKENIIIKI